MSLAWRGIAEVPANTDSETVRSRSTMSPPSRCSRRGCGCRGRGARQSIRGMAPRGASAQAQGNRNLCPQSCHPERSEPSASAVEGSRRGESDRSGFGDASRSLDKLGMTLSLNRNESMRPERRGPATAACCFDGERSEKATQTRTTEPREAVTGGVPTPRPRRSGSSRRRATVCSGAHSSRTSDLFSYQIGSYQIGKPCTDRIVCVRHHRHRCSLGLALSSDGRQCAQEENEYDSDHGGNAV